MKKTVADSITDKIKKGEVTMRSQFSIWMDILGLNGGVIGLFILLVSVAGIVLYWINSNNDLILGRYGRYGLSSFIQSFPYLFVVIFLVLFALLIIIFRKFDFSYKKPFFAFTFIILCGVLLIGWMTMRHPFGQRLYQQEGQVFRMGLMNNNNAVSGIVVEIDKETITVQDEKNKNTVLNLNSDTHFPFGTPKIGSSIRSIGIWDGVSFNAIGVRVFDNTDPSTLGPDTMRRQRSGRGMMWNK
ncbi:hypothetical protein COY90_00065 [Candidatus Roizmanbacteria bacterium CG_4_10_14_0_8_um_filter_39_9]|uniref:Uncharacterized protein n=1 Tax=Candidatus Roizmanbacteria bacterium CG_4_10_14_0_8_um_filter_39_9 TaxID=1974829 RepID=A0A2M7QF41_9BACT|nr:MAG: hypothetical protein COY90_00065 [Candidatus Roizmanbacteria bacterium CG_4_10_14_0_8_um_filter_39_9]